MTPERRKYLKTISRREKVLRDEIEIYKSKIRLEKWHLETTDFKFMNKYIKKRIKDLKTILCALKHELERIQPTTNVKYLNCPGGVLNYECCNCHEGIIVRWGDDLSKNCPHCRRKIEEVI